MSVLTLWARLSWSPWRFVACIVLQLLLTEYSADIQGAGAQHTTKFSFTQCLVNDKSAPRELPLRVRLLRSSKEPFYRVLLIVWWCERIRTFGRRKYWKHYKNKLPILWPRGLRRGFAAARLLELRFQIPLGDGCLSFVSVVCCQVEVSATGRSLLQRSPTECFVCVCD